MWVQCLAGLYIYMLLNTLLRTFWHTTIFSLPNIAMVGLGNLLPELRWWENETREWHGRRYPKRSRYLRVALPVLSTLSFQWGALCLSVPDILPNLEPEALNPRETQMNLEEDESGMCWPCAGSGGKQAMGGDEKPRPQGKAGCKWVCLVSLLWSRTSEKRAAGHSPEQEVQPPTQLDAGAQATSSRHRFSPSFHWIQSWVVPPLHTGRFCHQLPLATPAGKKSAYFSFFQHKSWSSLPWMNRDHELLDQWHGEMLWWVAVASCAYEAAWWLGPATDQSNGRRVGRGRFSKKFRVLLPG